jgi:predicted ATP-dependent endonuclease of OLD family
MIQHISIKNFKSIKSAETRIPEHVSAIVGLNGVGKTNLIQAINFVRNMAVGEDALLAMQRIALTPKEITNFNEASSEIYFGLTLCDIIENKYLYEAVFEATNTNIQNLVVKSEALYKYTEGEEKQLVYKRDDLRLTGQHNDIIPLAVERNKLAIASYQEANVLAVKAIFSNIIIPDQDAIEFRASIVKSGDKGLAGLIVRLRQSDPEAFEQFRKIVKKLLPTFSTIVELSTPVQQNPNTPPETVRPYMVLLEEADLKGQLSVKLLSSGDIRTLYIVASVLSLPHGSTFIIEEAENGLHPNRLTKLLDHLKMISLKRDIQIIYSTHSPIVINKLEAENVIFVEKDTPHGTRFHILSDTEHVTNIKRLLEDGLPLAEYMYSRMTPSN